ncbi:MAG: oligosaccharide flippase family protein [Bacteroidales bacterium]|jgi:O-antigen/teichoic acid export membrane protein|nr:oligosaccharide flippase family protein [Bacteroidales bacterium]
MSSINLKKNIIETIFVKGGILILNFAITFFVARLWGAEGKGIVALFVADLGIISIFCNIFTTSSVSYYLKKVGQSRLTTQAYIWVFIASGILALIMSFFGESNLILLLFIVSVLLGFVVFHSSLFIGDQKIPYYNLVTLLQPLLLLAFMLFFYFVFNNKFGYYSYFYSQIISLTLIFFVAKILTRKILGKSRFHLDKNTIKDSFNFGWKTELSNFLQFLNYRFSMYALSFLSGTEGLKLVGVFSIGVSISEAIWVFSKSISVVQYSNVLATGDSEVSRKETAKVSYISLLASLICIAIIAILPANVFVWLFGGEFEYVKTVILLMSPGILAISISNVYGNFFSAIGKLNILIIKSAAGLLVTITLSLLLISKMGITGACIVNSCAYIVSSVILIVYFFRKR